MEKSFLEKQIEKRAEERFEKEYNDLVKYIDNHSIGGKLKIRTSKLDKPIPLVDFGTNYAFFNNNQDENSNSNLSNYSEVKALMIQKYIEEETKTILSKLEHLEYLFNQK